MMRPVRLLLLCLATVMLAAACGKEEPVAQIPSQHWKEYTVDLQSRPTPVMKGMNEFIVIISRDKGKPAHDFIVSLRVNDTDPWKQMIQDGYMGVYRRAVAVQDPASQELNIQLQQGDDMGYLRFPLLAPQQPPVSRG
jgi:hypothetical protein